MLDSSKDRDLFVLFESDLYVLFEPFPVFSISGKDQVLVFLHEFTLQPFGGPLRIVAPEKEFLILSQ
ncbi:hypothetical protein C7R54_01540 [Achromobacter aloeverae]|uniref:Uncharacterized protein n=1 Tax=Achromobacter aloeverae TaxID=1750518 RepID=A0A4Q1HNT6_9BURK|nr:hypothetical protein C7R54_01540 [Achromobacter aloeverae]